MVNAILPGLLLILATALVNAQNLNNPNYWKNLYKRKVKTLLQNDYNNATAKNVIIAAADGLDLDFMAAARNYPNYWKNLYKRKVKTLLQNDYNNATAKNVIIAAADGLDLDFMAAARNYPKYWVNLYKREIKTLLQNDYNNATAKNVIIVAADGLDLDFMAAARANGVGETKSYNFEDFTDFAMAKTYCVDQQTPDQACAASALVSGIKTERGLVGLKPKAKKGDCSSGAGNRMTSFLDWAAAAGKRTGIVTNSRLTSPSVAPVYAHAVSSDLEGDVDVAAANAEPCNDIANQLVEGKTNSRFNVLFGGGRKYFLSNSTTDPETGLIDPKQRNDGNDPINTFMGGSGVRATVNNKVELNAVNTATTEHVLGLFNDDIMPLVEEADSSKFPTLAEMTTAALQILGQEPYGYALYIESSSIARALQQNKALDAFDEFADLVNTVAALPSDANTLVVVTGLRGQNMKLTGQQDIGDAVDGVSSDTVNIATDGKQRAALQFADGPGYENPRDLTPITASETFPSGIPMVMGTAGPQDVPVYARGPMSHLFRNVHEQNYIAHAASYAMCTGLYNRCLKRFPA